MATYVSTVRIEVEAENEDEARERFMEAVYLVDEHPELGPCVNIEVEVDFSEED
jgi:hypothetical protein